MGINHGCWCKIIPPCTGSDCRTWKCHICEWNSLFGILSKLIITKMGDDTETLRKVEALIQAEFKNGLPPHLQSNAKSHSYLSGSDQSQIFVASHSEFIKLHAKEVQRILHEHVILVHRQSFDYNYGWDLESISHLYDVDKKTTVHSEI